jgi:glutathione S-transferase
MITFFHSPQSRSTRVLGLLMAMGRLDSVDLRVVSIPRVDGSGGRDPLNPHPDGKVPLLVEDGVAVWESAAIMLHLTDRFPESNMGVPVGEPGRGRFVSWLTWYAGVVEPVLILDAAGISHLYIEASLRGVAEVRARLAAALAEGPWLMGERFTAADLLVSSPFLWFEGLDPGSEAARDWVARCAVHPRLAGVAEADERMTAELRGQVARAA